MRRKSVGYLRDIRHDVEASNKAMVEAAIDFHHAAEDIDMLCIDDIRTDEDGQYKDMMQAERALQKAIRQHKAAVKLLKEFFNF